MFADHTPDRVIDALRVVLAARANAELQGLWSEGETTYPAVQRTIARPIIRSEIAAETLPLLSIVRRSIRHDWQGKQPIHRSAMVLEYVGPRTSKDHLETRWPMLYPVYNAFEAALDGVVPSTGGGEVYTAAGMLDIPEESIRCDFNFYDLSGGAYPFFQMQFDVRHTKTGLEPWHEVRNLPVLRELFAMYIDARPAPEQPAVSTLTRTAAGEARDLASGVPFDDDSDEGNLE